MEGKELRVGRHEVTLQRRFAEVSGSIDDDLSRADRRAVVVRVTTWLLFAASGAQLVGLVWLLGAIGLVFLWFASQPLYRQGRGLGDGFFVMPGRGRWRLIDRHRTF